MAAAVGQLRSLEPGSAYRVDPDRIVLVGHSAGAWFALMAAAEDPRIEAVATIAGVNVGEFGRTLAGMEFDEAARLMEPPRGIEGITGEQLAREFINNADEFDWFSKVDRLARRSILLVAGQRDSIAPPQKYHWPLVKALEEEGAAHLTSVVLDDDHHFLNTRIALSRVIVDWLEQSMSD